MIMFQKYRFIILLWIMILIVVATSNYNLHDIVTVRVNTFRRNDLLKISLVHYLSCSSVKEIQVIWSDQKNQPPNINDIQDTTNKIKFKIYNKDSLNNRFLHDFDIKTEVVLSVDDDVIVPCSDLNFAIGVWSSNPKSLVGFSPRMTGFDPITGLDRYYRWQHTWWNGVYTVMLAKVALMSVSYLDAYKRMVPIQVLDYIDKHRNCEDLAMAYVVLLLSQAPPVWVKGNLREIGTSGISSNTDHFKARGECLSIIQTNIKALNPSSTESNTAVTSNLAWISGYQKSVPFGLGIGWDYGISDFMKLYFDTK